MVEYVGVHSFLFLLQDYNFLCCFWAYNIVNLYIALLIKCEEVNMGKVVKYKKRKSGVRYFKWLVILCVLLVMYKGFADNLSGKIDLDKVGKKIENYIELTMKQQNTGNGSGKPYSRNDHVSNSQQEIYDSIYEQIKEGATSFIVSFSSDDISTDDIGDEFSRLLDNHPEIFWLTGGASGKGVKTGVMTVYTYDLDTNCDISNLENMKNELENQVNAIVTQADTYSSEYEKALYVHDEIVRRCEYDTETYYGMKANDLVYTAYGCLVGNRAVCSGYAKAYQMIMNRLGIECGYVTGNATNSMGTGAHAWNYVKIDGAYYYVDVTWDDPLVIGGGSGDISHEYFCISYDEISKDHTFDEGQSEP